MEELMKKKKESLVLGHLLQKIAPQIGAVVLIEPEWGIVGWITALRENSSDKGTRSVLFQTKTLNTSSRLFATNMNRKHLPPRPRYIAFVAAILSGRE